MTPERRKCCFRDPNFKNFLGDKPPDPPGGCVDLVNLSSKKLDPPLNTVNKTAQPRGKRQKIKESNTQELNDVKLKVCKEALTFMKPDDHEEKYSDTRQGSELKSFCKVIEETLARFDDRQRFDDRHCKKKE